LALLGPHFSASGAGLKDPWNIRQIFQKSKNEGFQDSLHKEVGFRVRGIFQGSVGIFLENKQKKLLEMDVHQGKLSSANK